MRLFLCSDDQMIFNIAKSVMKQIVLTFLHAIIYQWKFSFMF